MSDQPTERPPPGSGMQWSTPAPAGPAGDQDSVRLQPLTLGDVLDGMFRLLLRHWRTYLLALGLLLVPVNIIGGLLSPDLADQPGLFELLRDPAAQDVLAGQAPPDVGGTYGWSFLVGVFVTPFVFGVSCVIAAAGHMGRQIEPGEALRSALGRYWALVAANVLLWVVGVVALIPGALIIGLGAASGSPPLIVLGVVLLLVTVAGALVYLALWPPAIVVEHLGPVAGLRRSFALVRGRFWRVFGTLLLAFLIAGLVGGVLGLPLGLVAAILGGVAGQLVVIIGNVVVGILTTPLMANAQTLVYFDGRVRKEGYDLELMAGGLRPPGLQRGASAPLRPPGPGPSGG